MPDRPETLVSLAGMLGLRVGLEDPLTLPELAELAAQLYRIDAHYRMLLRASAAPVLTEHESEEAKRLLARWRGVLGLQEHHELGNDMASFIKRCFGKRPALKVVRPCDSEVTE